MDSFRSWTRGRVARGLEQPELAEEYYLEAKGAFERQPNPFKAAQVALDLALLYFEQHRLQDLAAIAQETYDELCRQELHPETEQALLLFRRAAQRRQVALEVIRSAAEQLRQHQQCGGLVLC
jgi:hypothetical protein